MDCLREYWLNDPHINSSLPPRLKTFVFTCSLLEIILVVLTNLVPKEKQALGTAVQFKDCVVRAKKK